VLELSPGMLVNRGASPRLHQGQGSFKQGFGGSCTFNRTRNINLKGGGEKQLSIRASWGKTITLVDFSTERRGVAAVEAAPLDPD